MYSGTLLLHVQPFTSEKYAYNIKKWSAGILQLPSTYAPSIQIVMKGARILCAVPYSPHISPLSECLEN